MKHGKRPKLRHKVLLTSLGLRAREWLIVKEYPKTLIVMNRETGETKALEKLNAPVRQHKSIQKMVESIQVYFYSFYHIFGENSTSLVAE